MLKIMDYITAIVIGILCIFKQKIQQENLTILISKGESVDFVMVKLLLIF
jgi:hypothetical protein